MFSARQVRFPLEALTGVTVRLGEVGDGVAGFGHLLARNACTFIPVSVGVVVEHDVELSNESLKNGGNAGVIDEGKAAGGASTVRVVRVCPTTPDSPISNGRT